MGTGSLFGNSASILSVDVLSARVDRRRSCLSPPESLHPSIHPSSLSRGGVAPDPLAVSRFGRRASRPGGGALL